MKYEPNSTKLISSKKDFCVVRYYLDPWPTNFFKGHCIPFDYWYSVSEVPVWARLDKGERRYAPGQGFLSLFLLCSNPYLRTRDMFQGQWTPLRVKEREYMLRSSNLWRTDRRTDRLITIRRPGALIISTFRIRPRQCGTNITRVLGLNHSLCKGTRENNGEKAF